MQNDQLNSTLIEKLFFERGGGEEESVSFPVFQNVKNFSNIV